MQASARYYETGRRRGKCHTYFGSGGPSVFNGFMLSLQRLLNTRKASICGAVQAVRVSPWWAKSTIQLAKNYTPSTRYIHANYTPSTCCLHTTC